MSRSKLTRNQLAQFLPNPEAVKVFEQLLADVGIYLPNEVEAVGLAADAAAGEARESAKAVADLRQETEIQQAVTSAQVNELLGSLSEIAQNLALLATAPQKEDLVNPFDNQSSDLAPPNVKQNADLGLFPMQWPTKNPRGNGSWADLWVPDQRTFVETVLSLRNQSRDAGGTIYGLAAICMLDGAGAERGAVGYSRNSAIQPAGYTPDIVYVEFGDPFTGDANPSSFQLICTMAAGSAWFPGTTFVPMEHVTKTGETIMRVRGGKPLSIVGGSVTVSASAFTPTAGIDLQVRGAGNEYTIANKNSASKEWVWGVNGTTTYFRNITDNVTPVIYDNAGNTGFGIAPAEKVTVYSNTSEYAVSWAKVGSKKWVLGSYAGGSYLTNATDGRKHIQNLDTGETLIFGGGSEGMRITTGQNAVFKGTITHADTNLIRTSVALGNGAAAAAGTLANAPAAGNPTKWIPINDNGTTRYIPAW